MHAALDATILSKVVKAVGQVVCVTDVPITAGTRFAEDLGMDSLDVTEVVLAVEERFQTEISPDVAARFARVGDVAGYLNRRFFADSAELALAGSD